MSMSGTAVRCKMCETRNGVKRRIHASLFFFFFLKHPVYFWSEKISLFVQPLHGEFGTAWSENCAKSRYAWLSFLQDTHKGDSNHFGLKYTLPLHPLEHESRSGKQI